MKNPNLIKITQELLTQQYLNEEKSTREIAKENGCSAGHIKNKLKEYGIPPRGNSRLGRPNSAAGRTISKLKDKRFGKLMALYHIPKQGWKCLCDCGKTVVVRSHHLLQNRQKSCGCLLRSKGKANPNWKGTGEISARLFCSYRQGAKQRNLDFKITIDYAWQIFLSQKGKCPICGFDLTIGNNKKNTASLDRIDSSRGYVEGNIQWVHKRVNQMKWNNPTTEFIEWCKIITTYQESLLRD